MSNPIGPLRHSTGGIAAVHSAENSKKTLHLASEISTALLLASAAQGAPSGTLEEVVITAQRMKDSLQAELALTPGAITVIDGEDLYQRSVTSMTDLLRYVPGVWSESGWGSDELFLSSRGSNLDATDYDKNGIKLFQDGLPVTTADGNNHNRVLDPLSARYAIIARGANALIYGASTLGGAFDFISPTARTTAPLSIHVSGGSDGLLSGRVSAGGVADELDALVTLEGKTYDGYRDHSGQRRKGAYANVGWQMSDSVSTRIYATYVDNNEELPRSLTRQQVEENPRQAAVSAITGDNRKKVETARAAVKTTWQVDQAGSLQFGLWYENQSLYHPIVDVRGTDPDGDGPLLGPQFFSLLIDSEHRNLGGSIGYHTKIAHHDLRFGLTYGNTDVDGGRYRNLFGRRNGLMAYEEEHADSLEVFAVDRWQLGDAWTLVYGAHAIDTSREVRQTSPGGATLRNPKGDYSSVNPRLGVIHAISDSNEIFASVSRLFEPPTTFELADDACNCNDVLEPMNGIVLEAGVRGSTTTTAGTRWHWDAAVYYAKIHDEILSVEDPAAPGTSLSSNVDSTIHAGIEALFGAGFTLGGAAHRFEPLVSLTINDFSFDADAAYAHNTLPAAPKFAVRGELMYRHVGGLYAGPTFDLIGKRYADFANTYQVGAYELLGLRGGFSGERWELFGEVRNLLDRGYIAMLNVRDRAGPDADVLFPGAPRSVYVGARTQF